MFIRRQQGQELLGKDEYILSTSNFPRYRTFFKKSPSMKIPFFRNGCPDCTWPTYKSTPGTSASASLCFPDQVIFPAHPRFKYWLIRIIIIIIIFEFSEHWHEIFVYDVMLKSLSMFRVCPKLKIIFNMFD